jgi:hypothetical protein
MSNIDKHNLYITECGDIIAEMWSVKWEPDMEQQDLPNVFPAQSLEERLPKLPGIEQWITNSTASAVENNLRTYQKLCPNHTLSVGAPNENTYAMRRAGQSIKNTGRPLSSLGIVGIYARLREDNNG